MARYSESSDAKDLQLGEEEVKHGAFSCLLAVQLASHVNFNLGQLALLDRGGNLLCCGLNSFDKLSVQRAGFRNDATTMYTRKSRT